MTVFKTYLKILNKCKFVVIVFSIMLILFSIFNMQTSDNTTNFTASKPNVFIVNQDQNIGITKNLINYFSENCNIIELEDKEDVLNDALFYRDVSYIIYIPEHYRDNFLEGLNPEIQIKSTGDYESSYAQMLLERYIRVANIYEKSYTDEDEMIEHINETLSKQIQIELTTKLDTNQLEKAAFYYNFANYSILAGCVYVICLILSSFKDEKIRKRIIISSMKDRVHNRLLLIANSLFAITLWACYVLLSFIVVGNVMFDIQGIFYIINSFIFTMCALTIAFLIANLVSNKNAINGIVNVIALGTSFLCGAFVPMQWLPNSVIAIAHVLPSYYYISTNEMLKTMETFNFQTMQPILINMGIVIVFSIGFIVCSNIISRKKRRIG